MSESEPRLLGGRYELGPLLGRGGMADVRRAYDRRLGRTVAIKQLRTDLTALSEEGDGTFLIRFRREAQSAAALNHPSIVSVYDTGEDSGQPYIVMEYVEGRTLRDVLREGRKIRPERALEITSDILSALDYSHTHGIIHRDIKPANVMLTPAGDVKVMDFGIARAASETASSVTQTSAVVGTAQYLSPEQARGETVDARSDVYSTGCVLYELLTGRPPFVGDSPVAVAYQHVREAPVAPSHHDAALPPVIDAIVLKALAKRRDERYQSAAAMRADIERYLAGQAVVIDPPAHSPLDDLVRTQVAGAPVRAASRTSDSEPGDRSRTTMLAILGVVVVALVALIAILLPMLFSSAPSEAQVPDVSGMTQAQAETKLSDSKFSPSFGGFEPSETVAEGLVTRQDPQGGIGEFAEEGTTVTFWVSSGRQQLAVPNVIGEPYANAKADLEADPYDFQVTRTDVDSDLPQGQVLSITPDVGSAAFRGDPVTVTVSRGPKSVPTVTNWTEEAATNAITAAGFTAKVVDDTASTLTYGTVTQQSPAGGTAAPAGTEVVIWVSRHTLSACDLNPSGTDESGQPCGAASTPAG